MSLRRSTRVASGSKDSPALSNTVDLLSASSESPPPPPAKKARATAPKGKGKGKGKAAPAFDDSDDDVLVVEASGGDAKRVVEVVEADADAALARQLQDEENKAGRMLDNDEVPFASTSSSSHLPARRLPASRAGFSTIPNKASSSNDPNDPREVVREHVILMPDADLDSLMALSGLSCPSCSTTFCRGCSTPLPNDEGRAAGKCCAEGRAIVLFELLSALDTVYLGDHLSKPTPADTTPSSKKKKAAASSKGKGKAITGTGAGTGYGSGAGAAAYNYGYGAVAPSNGTGYAPDHGHDGYSEDEDWDAWEDMMVDEFGEDYDPMMAGESDEDAFQEFRAKRKAEREKDKPKPTTTYPDRLSHDDTQDKLYLRLLTLLRPLLPHPDAPTAQIYDFLPHPTFSALLALSTLPDLLATLLRNDSVVEWQRRNEVYFAMLGVLEALGGSEATLETLFGERRDKKWSEGLRAFVEGRGDVRWERKMVKKLIEPTEVPNKGRGRKRKAGVSEEVFVEEGEIIMAVPLLSLLRKLSTQAEAFRRAALTGSLEDADASLIGICGDFAEAGERCKGLVKVWEEKQARDRGAEGFSAADMAPEENQVQGGVMRVEGQGKGKGVERMWTEEDYATACGKLAYYRRDAESIANHRRSHNSFVHLAKELAVLSTSLPPGIWVRVDEARVDVLKVLIAGPEDSPYAGGLFEFDIFIPLEYPNKSPSCWLKTTGGNKCRFNPNLYAEGKVCLSLLGTWAGSPEEMWQPNKSTILQVLLSITSMILGTNYPRYNEPGYGAPRDDKLNKTYNSNCSLATTRWAILDWIDGDKFKDSMWSDVIASHILLNRSTIASTVSTWAAKDPRMRKWTPSFNATAGTDRLEPFNMAQYYADLNAQASIGVGGKKGKGKKKAVVAEQPKQPEGPTPRDLVKEVEEALDKLERWKGREWLVKLVNKV
ncbi:hypothetical protein JCM11251_002239 [Rhodosporidiobolus azoricus]